MDPSSVVYIHSNFYYYFDTTASTNTTKSIKSRIASNKLFLQQNRPTVVTTNMGSYFLFFLFIFGNVDSILLDIQISVCTDSERVDFKSSCINKEPECIQDLDYLKNFQDYKDFYVRFKGKIYHAFEDVLYFQKCELTKKIVIPEVVTECTKDIPVTYIDALGSNKTGYLTEYELIRPNVRTHLRKRQVCTTGTERIIYSLPDGLRTLVRLGTELDLISLNRLGKAYEIIMNEPDLKSAYKEYLQNNLDYLIFKDCLIFFLFFMFILILVYFSKTFFKKRKEVSTETDNPIINISKSNETKDFNSNDLSKKKKAELILIAKEFNIEYDCNKDELINRLKQKANN